MRHVFILCNALDDETRLARGITTDSPAASRKVFMAAKAIRDTGVRTTIISLGRGRRTGGYAVHDTLVRRSDRVSTIYLRFVNRPIWSELTSLCAAALAVARCHRRDNTETLMLYNRAPAYVLAMIVARLSGMRLVLDLEDGFEGVERSLRGLRRRLTDRLFDMLCDRAMLACSALLAETRLRPVLTYYGIAPLTPFRPRGNPVVALMGGTVSAVQGGDRLVDAIRHLRAIHDSWTNSLAIEVTGKGDSIARLQSLAGVGPPSVTVWGRTTDTDYAAIVQRAGVGLSLKPNGGSLALTTFPSKVIEMAAAGQLVVTTDISDVRKVLGDDGAIYLSNDDTASLVAALRWIVANRRAANLIAERGTAAVQRRCEAGAAGLRLADFLFGVAERAA